MNEPVKITYNGTELTRVTDVKYLGVNIDHQLDWKVHIKKNIIKTGSDYRNFPQNQQKHPETTETTTIFCHVQQPNNIWNPIMVLSIRNKHKTTTATPKQSNKKSF